MEPKNLVEMLYNSTKRNPAKTACMWKENGSYQSVSYQELWKTIYSLAKGLRQLNIGKDSKVAIFAENSPRWLISDFAILSLGAISVPIYQTLSGQQAAFILQNADVEVAIVQTSEMVNRIKSWPPSVRSIILMENEPCNHPLVVPFEQVVQSTARMEEKWEWENLTWDDIATMVHTSGTTGNPKGVLLSHGNILSNVIGSQYIIPVSPDDLAFSFLPLSHIFERTCNHFTSMYIGGTIAYAESIAKVPQNILEVKPTVLTSVPRLYEKVYSQIHQQISSGPWLKRKIFNWALDQASKRQSFMQNGNLSPIPLSIDIRYRLAHKLVFSKIHEKLGGRLRLMVSGGGALDGTISQFFYDIGLPILEGYGLTECSPVISANPLNRPKPGTVGRPLPGTEIKIAEDGELLVKSQSVMMGYYKQPEETNKTLENGWLHTGDIVQMDDDGYLRIVDRKKNILVLSTGKNVAPQPIESALCISPFIHQAVLIGNKRKYVSALIVPDYEALKQRALQKGWDAQSKESLAHSPETRQFIQQEIDHLLKDFADFEKPKKFALLQDEFSIDKGELTPSLKIRLKEVEKNYASLISSLYEEQPSKSEVAVTTEIYNNNTSPEVKSKPKSDTNQVIPLIKHPQLWIGILIGVTAGILVRYLFFS